MSKKKDKLNTENLNTQPEVAETQPVETLDIPPMDEEADLLGIPETEEISDEIVERDPDYNKKIATALGKQNPKRAKEIVKERLSMMSPEEIAALRAAKEAKLEAERAAAAAAEEEFSRLQQEALNSNKLSEEQKMRIVEQLAQLSPAQLEAVRQSRVAKNADDAEKASKGRKKKTKPEKESKHKISYEYRQAFTGFMFVLPWFLGFLLFFAYPCFQSLRYSFSQVSVFENYKCTWSGLDNYAEILTGDAIFMKNLVSTLTDLAINVPIILIFSLFVAVLLNRKFVGRGLVRGIFFLPVIVTTGIVMTTFNSSSDASAVMEGDVGNGVLFEVANASEFLAELGLNEKLTEYMTLVADRIFDVVWDSGIQILLFLAALQGISPSLYEASDVEGATAWETFWLITFPNVAPIILVNIVYTIVDTFGDTDNAVLRQINTLINANFNFGGAAAASWVFFVTILAIIGVVFVVFQLLNRNSR